jgi:thiamine kinase-like enzyme
MAARHRRNASIEGWMAITNELEAAQAPLPVVFGHHDLLAANFFDDGKRLWLIDWEYAAFGTAMFDLANLSANNSFDDALDEDMLRTYFGGAHNRAIEKSFAAMKTASALREAMWAMVSELYLSAPGADYAAHAATYLERFEKLLTAYRKEFH